MEVLSIENIVSFIFIYIIIWWLSLFCVLPFWLEHNKGEKEDQSFDSGAPKKANIKKKFIITSLIALILTSITTYVLKFII